MVVWQPYLWPGRRPADPARIDAAEARLGVRFPADYRACVTEAQGMTPEPSRFAFGDAETVLNHLLHFDTDQPGYSLERAQARLGLSGLPEGLVVFAQDPGGNAICFDFRNDPGAPAVVILDHETGAREPVFVAAGFGDFLSLLR